MHAVQLMAWQVLVQMEEHGHEHYAEHMEAAQQMSVLGWVYNALGPMYMLLLPLLGLVAFVGAVLVVVKNRRPADIASYVYFAAAPAVLGVFGVVHGMISSYQIIAMAESTPKASEIAMGISTSLFAALIGLMCSFPAYGMLGLGYLVRTLMIRDGQQDQKPV